MIQVKYEIVLWFNKILKIIPGNLGCKIRSLLLPINIHYSSKIWDGVQIDSPSKLTIGSNCSINRGCIINAAGGIQIGKDVMIGPNVIIYSQNHNISNSNTLFRNQGYSVKSVTIGDNVWVAAGVIILPGITIGSNSVIAAGSIVTKSVAPATLVGGNPAKLIKHL